MVAADNWNAAMKKIFLASVAALFLATGTAHAGQVPKELWIPPAEFDHPYNGRIHIIELPRADIRLKFLAPGKLDLASVNDPFKSSGTMCIEQ